MKKQAYKKAPTNGTLKIWWCYLIFERKAGICPLLWGHFANDLYAKIVSLIVKNTRFENIS
jgi:hypothetical protein